MMPMDISGGVCTQKYTNTPLNGYYCASQTDTTLLGVTQALCTHACLTSPGCAALSYNGATGNCSLVTQPCASARKHDDSLLMILRDQQDIDCIVWVQDEDGVVPDRMLTDSYSVGRVSVDGDVLVGQADRPGGNWNTYIAHEGNQIYFPNENILTVHPTCTVAWVPYKAGDILPHTAVGTGMLADDRHLYSTLSWHASAGYWRIGSYAEGDTAAYYAYSGSNAVTEFDILVSV